jgi:outer membrane protein TolC
MLACVCLTSGLYAAELPSGSLESYLSRAQSTNPQLKAFQQRYAAAMQRIPQASALPDPMFQITSFVESVQTRTGPQENVLMLSQKIPWFGKLSSRADAASIEAEALWYAYQNQQLMLARMVALSILRIRLHQRGDSTHSKESRSTERAGTNRGRKSAGGRRDQRSASPQGGDR